MGFCVNLKNVNTMQTEFAKQHILFCIKTVKKLFYHGCSNSFRHWVQSFLFKRANPAFESTIVCEALYSLDLFILAMCCCLNTNDLHDVARKETKDF